MSNSALRSPLAAADFAFGGRRCADLAFPSEEEKLLADCYSIAETESGTSISIERRPVILPTS
jgi:hypothetical protein